MIGFFVKDSDGVIVFYGERENKPNLETGHTFVPSSDSPPDGKFTDSDYIRQSGSWVISQKIVSQKLIDSVNQEAKKRFAKGDLVVKCYEEEVELIKRGLSDTIQSLTGTANFTKDSETITGIGTLFLSELDPTIDWIRSDDDGDFYPIKQVNSDTEALIPLKYLRDISSGNISKASTAVTKNKYESWIDYRFKTINILKETPLAGNLTFYNNSDIVDGSGTSFLTELVIGQYLKLDADSIFYKILDIPSNVQLQLQRAYQETGGTGAAKKIIDLDSPSWPTEPS